MNPNPLVVLNHFTVPVGMVVFSRVEWGRPHAVWSHSGESGALTLGQRLEFGASQWRLAGEFGDPMGHRARRHAELACRPGEALVPRGHFEETDRIERRPAYRLAHRSHPVSRCIVVR